jgi:diguanylate cyclase (GGDEF)-like protein
MSDLVELGLKRPGGTVAGPAGAAGDPNLTAFLDRLLGTLSRFAPAADAADTDTFRKKLDEYRHTLLDPSRRLENPRVTDACVAACQHYFGASDRYHTDRANELTDVIRILRDAAHITIGHNAEFHAGLVGTSDRLDHLAQLDDIRDVKRRLREEVESLRQTIELKQQQDQLAHAQLNSRVEALQSRLTEVEEEASRDPLTKIANRKRFDQTLPRWLKAAQEAHTPLALAMLDIDNFKVINDTHGHQVGDRVLLCAAQALTGGLRQTDFVARYGGEEFVVLLANTGASQVEGRLAGLLERIAQSSYEYELLGEKERVRFTLSCGLTERQPNDTEEALIRRADEALYEAKRKGKNRVIFKKRRFGGLLSWK